MTDVRLKLASQPSLRLSVPINGLVGEQGPQGTPGTNGQDGGQIFVQNSAPATIWPEGSLWIDDDSIDLDLYTLTGGSWSDTGKNLKGEAGDQIYVQASAPSTTGVPDGSIWIDSDSADYDLFVLTGGAWVDSGANLKGAVGGTPAGSNTQVQYNGSGSFAANAALTFDAATKVLGGTDLVISPGGTGGFLASITNPTVGGDNNYRRAADITVFNAHPLNHNPNFSSVTTLGVTLNADNGDNLHGAGTSAKTTFTALSMSVDANAAGQRFTQQNVLTAWGMGDSALYTGRSTFAGGPISGDEGQGYNLVQSLKQQEHLTLTTITDTPALATINTTTTAGITASKDPQTVPVVSSAGVSAGQWIIVNQSVDAGANNIEAVQVISVPSGSSIEGRFRTNQSSGATIRPAKVISVDNAGFFGEHRVLVNLSGASYSTGTVTTAGPGANFAASGTTWANNMVGGDATCIGAISLDNDTFTGPPFNGGGSNGPLRSWHQIKQVTSTTSLDIHSYSVAGALNYKGKGAGSGGYIVRPAMRVLRIIGSTIVCEANTSTWTVGDTVELAICPYPDVTGWQYHFGVWTPCGTLRDYMHIKNTGARKFENCIHIDDTVSSAGGGDDTAFGTGIMIDAECDNAIIVGGCNSTGLRLFQAGNPGAKIGWLTSGCWITNDSTNLGLEIAGCDNHTSQVGRVNFTNASVSSSGVEEMRWGGIFTTPEGVQLPNIERSSLPNPAVRGQLLRLETDPADSKQHLIYSDGSLWRATGPRSRTTTSDFSKTSSTSLDEITNLSWQVQAGRTYRFEIELPFTCAAAGGVQVDLSGTATATYVIYDGWIVDSAANGIKGSAQATALGGVVASAVTTGTAGHITVKGTIVVNAAGTLFPRFAQNTSNGTASTVKRGATFTIHELA